MTTNNPPPAVQYSTLFGRLLGLISMYEIGVTSRAEFIKKAHAIEAEFKLQSEQVHSYYTKEFNEAITGDTK